MGFETKYEQRNQYIPTYRQQLMTAIELDLMQDEHIVAIFYGGSIGHENTDLFSDIDLRIVVEDAFFEAYRLAKTKRATRWGDVLFFEDVPSTNYSTAHYKGFIKVDSFYYKASDMTASVWLQKVKIVQDRTRLIENIVKQSRKLTYRPSTSEIEQWRATFFAHLHEAYRRAMRNELYYALRCLDNLRLSIVTGWYMDMGLQPNTFGDWAKLEGERSKLNEQQRSLLAQWHSLRERQHVLDVMRAIVLEFKHIHQKLCAQYDIEEQRALVDEILHMVM